VDTLSRIYSNDESGTIHAHSEYTEHDDDKNDALNTHDVSMPLLVGLEAKAASLASIKNQEGESKSTSRLPDGLAVPIPGTGRGCQNWRAPGDYATLNEGTEITGKQPEYSKSPWDSVKWIKSVVPKVKDPHEQKEGGSKDKSDASQGKPPAESDQAQEEIKPLET
jgi:hypothetical protein